MVEEILTWIFYGIYTEKVLTGWRDGILHYLEWLPFDAPLLGFLKVFLKNGKKSWHQSFYQIVLRVLLFVYLPLRKGIQLYELEQAFVPDQYLRKAPTFVFLTHVAGSGIHQGSTNQSIGLLPILGVFFKSLLFFWACFCDPMAGVCEVEIPGCERAADIVVLQGLPHKPLPDDETKVFHPTDSDCNPNHEDVCEGHYWLLLDVQDSILCVVLVVHNRPISESPEQRNKSSRALAVMRNRKSSPKRS